MKRSYSPLLLAGLLLAACGHKDVPKPTPTGPLTQQELNAWMLDSMHTYYLWNNNLPQKADGNAAPLAYFNTLKAATDSFSLVYNPYNGSVVTPYLLDRFGLDFNIIAWPGAPGGSIGIVTLVIPGSVAEAAGWQRGSYFTRINGVALNAGNAAGLTQSLLTAIMDGNLTPATISGNTIVEEEAKTLSPNHLGEPAHYQDTTLLSGAQKTAYLFYNTFSDTSNTSLIQSFQAFKAAGVKELVLDFRYNAGGSVAAAAALCAMIAPGVNAASNFLQYTGNNHLGQHLYTFDQVLAHPVAGAPTPFSTLAAARLSLTRVFVLTSKQTASAAELVINNLKPYLQVITIGGTTYGKDKAAVVITDQRNPQRVPWIMRPIAYLLANAKGEGSYATGLTPTYTADEMGLQPLPPLGNANDVLLAKALAIISGNARMSSPQQVAPVKVYNQHPAREMILSR